jgi:hypothetical protein
MGTLPRGGISDFGLVTAKLKAKPDFGFSATHSTNHRDTERTQRKTQRISQLGLDETVRHPPILGRVTSFEF